MKKEIQLDLKQRQYSISLRKIQIKAPLTLCSLPMNSMKRQNDRILKEELPRSAGTQYATKDQWRNKSRKNEGIKPKQKQY